MMTIISVTVVISILFITIFQSIKNVKNGRVVDVKAKVMPRLLCIMAIMFSCGMMCGSGLPFRLLTDMTIAVSAMSVLTISIRRPDRKGRVSKMILALLVLMTIYYLFCTVGLLPVLPDRYFLILADIIVLAAAISFIWMIWRRLRDVKAVIRSGNTWSYVRLCVDAVHAFVPIMILLFLHTLYVIFPDNSFLIVQLAVFLLLLELIAIAIRISFDSVFVIMHDHERVIVESMKLSYMEMSVNPENKAGEQYKDLYERIIRYFETEKPYLDGNLTINNVVKVVYSNKVYISKAICHYTGRNFRQFVNYHRVMYSMDVFRANPELKVSELSEMCGFNTMVSFTMAFRLFMNETPSEWCRKERAKILKPKK